MHDNDSTTKYINKSSNTTNNAHIKHSVDHIQQCFSNLFFEENFSNNFDSYGTSRTSTVA